MFISQEVELSDIETLPRRFTSGSTPIHQFFDTGGTPIADDATTHSYYLLDRVNYNEPGAIVRYDEATDSALNAFPTPPPLSQLTLRCRIAGAALDGLRELLLSGSTGANCNLPAVSVFGPDANGSVGPVRTVAGPHTTLQNPTSIALGR